MFFSKCISLSDIGRSETPSNRSRLGKLSLYGVVVSGAQVNLTVRIGLLTGERESS